MRRSACAVPITNPLVVPDEIFARVSFPNLAKSDRYFDRLLAFYEDSQPNNSVTKFLSSLESSKSECTIKTYHTQLLITLRDFLYIDYELPSPEFDDIAAFLEMTEKAHLADNMESQGKLSEKDKVEFQKRLETHADNLPARPAHHTDIVEANDLFPGFKAERKNGQLRMQLRGEPKEAFRSEMRQDDERVINIVLNCLAQDRNRSLWPHLYKVDRVSHVIAIPKIAKEKANKSGIRKVKDKINDKKERGSSPGTLNLRRAVLTKFEKYLSDSDELSNSRLVMPNVDRMRNPIRQKPVFSEAEVTKVLNHVTKVANDITSDRGWMKIRDLALFEVLDSTLLRAGAICRIKLADLDLANRILYVPLEKGGKSRILTLNPRTVKELKSYLLIRAKKLKRNGIDPEDQRSLFLSKTGEQLHPRHFDDIVHKAVIAAKVRQPSIGRWGPHSWRHSLATHIYINSGGDISVVQAILGHASPETTARYIATGMDQANHQKHKQFHPRAFGR